ncbi:hypothetical protein ABZ930_15800 [Streptomyces sp. NPDC046716]|uniref:hypothetical protein n=1 Tax=Streptomyces sp. NPDC046716 TaxID=3157093 RepID=UPI0033BFF068
MHTDHPTLRGSRGTRVTGRLLCTSLGAAMVVSALDVTVSAHLPAWWPVVWTVLWSAVPVSAVAWAVARCREKRSDAMAGGDGGEDAVAALLDGLPVQAPRAMDEQQAEHTGPGEHEARAERPARTGDSRQGCK